jgi:hypothetical protein
MFNQKVFADPLVGACWCLLVLAGACWCLLVLAGACWCLLVRGNRGILGLDYQEVDDNAHDDADNDDAREHHADNRLDRQRRNVFQL